MGKGVELAREELIRLMTILENVAKLRIEPFSVDIKGLLERLRSIIEEHRDTETVVLDAETLYRVSVVLGVQQKWIRDRASSLFIDGQLIYSRIAAASQVALVEAFLSAWRPIVRVEQVTIPALLRGYDHFLSLPSRSKGRGEGRSPSLSAEVGDYGVERDEGVLEKMEEVRRELAKVGDDWIDYWEFVMRGDFRERFERAYVLSFLISRGEVEVVINPLNGRIRMRPRRVPEVAERKVSLVTIIKATEDG